MSITLYSRYRRQGLRRAWEFAGMAEWCRNVGLYLVAFVVALGLVAWIDAQAEAADRAELARTKAERTAAHQESVWLSCLNHKGVYLNGRLHLCSLADTYLAKGDFK